MKLIRSTVLAAGLVASLTLVSGPVSAHHSFGHYDMTKTVDVTGSVVKYEWSNPHSWLFITANGPDGKPTTYGFELQSVGEMLRRGWKKTVLAPGDKVTISYRPMRDGTPAGLLVNAKDGAGKQIGNPPPAGGPPGGPPA
jgi:hypothetical protein